MALTKCKECGTEISSKAESCPKCGAPVRRKSSPLAIGCLTILVLLIGIGVLGSLMGDGAEQVSRDIENRVAADTVQQYEIAKRNGNAMDVCVHAGLVAAAFIQAKAEQHYQQWKRIESDDCARAGLPR